MCFLLAEAGIACAPVNNAADIVNDEHVKNRNMIVEIPRTDGVEQPIIVRATPSSSRRCRRAPETRMPWVGEHTAEILTAELGLDDDQLAKLRGDGVIN